MKKNFFLTLILFFINTIIITSVQGIKPTRLAIFAGNENASSSAMAGSFKEIIEQAVCHVIVSKSILESCFIHYNQCDPVFNLNNHDSYHIPTTTYFLFVSKKKANPSYFKIDTFTKKEHATKLQDFIINKLDNSLLNDALPLIFFTAKDKAQTNSEESVDLAQANMPPLNIIFSGHGSSNSLIAGLELDDFNKTLYFFNTQVLTNIMIIFSCCAAGENQKYYMNFYKKECEEAIKPLNLNYLLVIQGIQGAKTSVYLKEYEDFFKTLESENTIEDRTLAKAITYITANNRWFLDYSGINNIPQLLIPNVGWKPLVDKIPYITNITNTKLIAADHDEGQYCLKNALAAILEPETIKTPITILPCQNPFINNTEIPDWLLLSNLYYYFPIYSIEFNNTQTLDLTIFNKSNNKKKSSYFPILISLKKKLFFKKIILDQTTQQGILEFFRDSFLNSQNRQEDRLFFIEELIGFNDILKTLQGIRFLKKKKQEVNTTWNNLINNFDNIIQSVTKNNWNTFLNQVDRNQSELEKALIANNNSLITLQDVILKSSFNQTLGTFFYISFFFKDKQYAYTEYYDPNCLIPSWNFSDINSYNIFDDDAGHILKNDIKHFKEYNNSHETLNVLFSSNHLLRIIQEKLKQLKNELTQAREKLQMLQESLSQLLLAVKSIT